MKTLNRDSATRIGHQAAFWVLVLSAYRASASDIVLSNRLITWGNAGVRGGIPIRSTIYSNFNADGYATVAHIQSAINSCPSNQVVFLNAGTYTFSSSLTIGSYMTLRGATNASGAPTTFINDSADDFGQFMFRNSLYPCEGPGACGGTVYSNNVTAGLTKGSTNITVSGSLANLTVGQIMVIDQLADNTIVFDYGPRNGSGESPHGSVWCRQGVRALSQFVVVTAKGSSDVTFMPPIYSAYWTNTMTPAIFYWADSSAVKGGGMENIQVNRSGGASSIVEIGPAIDCWVKNCVLSKPPAGVRFESAVFCEVDHSAVKGPFDSNGSGNYAFFLTSSSACKIEDNIVSNAPATLACASASGCVFSYNYITNCPYSTPTYLAEIVNLSHGAHCTYNLAEGNWSPAMWADTYHGNSSFLLYARNRVLGYDGGKTDSLRCMNTDYHCDYNSIVGNVLGDDSHQTVYRNTSGSYCDFCILDLNEDNAGEPVGLTLYGNWNTVSNAIPAVENPGGSTISNSYYLASKPIWFGNRPWPPFDSSSPSAATPTNIPAGYRYFVGSDPPSDNSVRHSVLQITN